MIEWLRSRLRGPVPRRMDAIPERLPPCPSSGNCVCSEYPDAPGHVAALPAGADPRATLALLADRLRRWPRTHIRLQTRDYLHVECESRVFGFVDDLELRIDHEQGAIQIRSAARRGRYDFGVNRRRVARLRRLLDAPRHSG